MALWKEFNVMRIEKTEGVFSENYISKNVISECKMSIFINGKLFSETVCSDDALTQLAIGFAANEGIIETMRDIKNYELLRKCDNPEEAAVFKMELEDEALRVADKDGFINAASFKISIYEIFEHMRLFMKRSGIFEVVGGVHSSMLTIYDDAGKICKEVFYEDIGRHNCFDKIAGDLILDNASLREKKAVLYVSGRMSSEIILKVIKTGIPIVVSRSTPTATAVELAEKHGITLLGFVRGDEGVLYSREDRIEI